MSNKTIQCSVAEYGALRMQPTGRPITRQSIIERIRANKEMPGVKSSKKIGNQWVMEIEESFYNAWKNNLD